jgi:hypothetical protein
MFRHLAPIIILILFSFASLRAFAIPPVDIGGDFWVAKQNFTTKAVFGKRILGHVIGESSTVALSIQTGQAMNLKYDLSTFMYYLEVDRPGKAEIDHTKVYFTEQEVKSLFGDPVPNGSKDPHAQLEPLFAPYYHGDRAIHIVSEDEDPTNLAIDRGPRDINATGREYIHDVHLAKDGKTKIRIKETRIIPLPIHGKEHWTIVQDVCITSSMLTTPRCGWVLAAALRENGAPKLTGLCDIGIPQSTRNQAQVAADVAKEVLALEQPATPKKPLIPFMKPKAAEPDLDFIDAIGMCALDNPDAPSSALNLNPKSGSTYVDMLQPKVKKLYPRVKFPSDVTVDQFEAVDLFARTLFGEMRGCEVKTGDDRYTKAIARITYNRANTCGNDGTFKRGDFPVKAPTSKAILSNYAYSMWNNRHQVPSTLIPHLKENLRSSLCPDIEEDPRTQKAWDGMKKLAAGILLDPVKREAFLEETKSLAKDCYFSSGKDANISGVHEETTPRPSIDGRKLSDISCLRVWRDKTPDEKTRAAQPVRQPAKATKKTKRKK